MVEHPSIHDLSAPSFDRSCGGFAAKCRLSRRYRSTVAAAVGAQQQWRRTTGRQHGAQQRIRAVSH